MKKKEIIAYITGKVDVFEKHTKEADSDSKKVFGLISYELNQILDFALDNKKSEKEKDWEITFEKQENRIKELEELYEGACEAKKNLHKKIEKLETERLALEIISNERKSKIDDFNKNTWSK